MSDEFPYKFNPSKNITAYELALIFKKDNWLNAHEELFQKLPVELQKYYKKENV